VNLTSISDVRALLTALEVSPNRTLSQNFLIDRNILGILLAAADLAPSDGVLEIGPGLGVVTEQLAAKAGRVVAIEKDARLAAFLAERFAGAAALQLIHADALEVDLAALLATGIDKVVSNLPYAAGTRILVELATARAAPALMVVTVQEEVARRMAAAPGNKTYGALTVWLALDYEVESVKTVSPTCFWPPPDVSSAIVRLRRRQSQAEDGADKTFVRELVRQAFTHRRKQLATILGGAPREFRVPTARAAALLAELGLDPKARPENLSPSDWGSLAQALRAK
jgi:16S rRNA (adenine1518-N6/adenine1519-N6)-dimethyltransferase